MAAQQQFQRTSFPTTTQSGREQAVARGMLSSIQVYSNIFPNNDPTILHPVYDVEVPMIKQLHHTTTLLINIVIYCTILPTLR